MTKPHNPGRRETFKKVLLGGAALGSLSAIELSEPGSTRLKGNIKHGVCLWSMQPLSLDELCAGAQKIGIQGIDIVGPESYPTLKKYGLHCSMSNGAEISIADGWSDPKFHKQLIKNYKEVIPIVAKNGFTNLIAFSGNRRGMDDETGMKNCQKGLEQIMATAEKYGVVIQMELLNSKVNHKDYLCDSSPWGVELCKRLGSDHFKLLYDIYHMQIDEGDIIRTIQDYHPYFGHYHTAGNPGRNELDENQEINYPAVMRAIVATGYQGFVSHEFIPKQEDKLKALQEAVDVCDV